MSQNSSKPSVRTAEAQSEVPKASPSEVLSDNVPEVYICSSCSQGADLRGSLAKVDELVRRLEAEGYSKELDDKMEALPGCHPNFHLRFDNFVSFFSTVWV